MCERLENESLPCPVKNITFPCETRKSNPLSVPKRAIRGEQSLRALIRFGALEAAALTVAGSSSATTKTRPTIVSNCTDALCLFLFLSFLSQISFSLSLFSYCPFPYYWCLAELKKCRKKRVFQIPSEFRLVDEMPSTL